MKLSELDAKFYEINGRKGMGVILRVPGTTPTETLDPKIAIPFTNPLDGGLPDATSKSTWIRTGDTIDTLSLMPSVNVLEPVPWHGWIKNGEVILA